MIVLRKLQPSGPSLRKDLVLLKEKWRGPAQNKFGPRKRERIHLYSRVSHMRLHQVQLLH